MRNEDSASTRAPASADGSTERALLAKPGSGIGRSHGTSNSAPFDRWFRYPAGFASDYVELLLSQLKIKPDGLLVDPFTGSGVTGTTARSLGLSFYGIEAHPDIAELAALKTIVPPGSSADFYSTAEKIADLASRRYDAGGVAVNHEPDLVLRSFLPETLSKLISIRQFITAGSALEWGPYMKWTLLSTLRDVASVRVGWPYQYPGREKRARYSDPYARFLQRAKWIAEDLSTATEREVSGQQLQIVHGDSTSPDAWRGLIGRSADGCVSSPPYLNNFDYADATRLELYFWGEVSSWSEMCSTVRSKMITATTQQSSVGSAREARLKLDKYGSVAGMIDEVIEKLQAERISRARGKEYDRVVPDYFAAIGEVLENLAGSLNPGSPVAWLVGDSAPYGVYVNTPHIIATIAEQVGFDAQQDVELRRRGQRWASNAMRHQVELSERLILLRRK